MHTGTKEFSITHSKVIRRFAMLAALLAMPSVVLGYFVEPPLSLEALEAKADIIFKGTVVSSKPLQGTERSGFFTTDTQFTNISVIKGNPVGATITFRHTDKSSEAPMFSGNPRPQHYHFQSNRTYIVFAEKTSDEATYCQLWTRQRGKSDQGVMLCADNKPAVGKNIKEVLWNNLTLLLKDADVTNVTYAIRQLDEMSGGRPEYSGTRDFARTNVLTVVHDLMTSPEPKIALAAIDVIGSGNPYLSDGHTDFWLATVGSAEVPGLAKMDPRMRNIGGELYWKELKAIADSNRPAETRALAIRALGLVREPALRVAIKRWLADKQALVRAAATVLLADFPGPETNPHLIALAGDPEPVVRGCVARAIGFSQQTDLVGVLDKLLTDTDSAVRRVASVSLLSFSPKNESVARVFQKNLENKEFEPLFLNALARENPEPYLDGLSRAVEEKLEPKNWGGGQIPAFTSWKILFLYLQGQPAETLKSGKIDRYLDALEKVGNYSSSEPRDIYAFYILSGMPERAQKFRERANKAASYDLDSSFKQVDQNPSSYKHSLEAFGKPVLSPPSTNAPVRAIPRAIRANPAN